MTRIENVTGIKVFNSAVKKSEIREVTMGHNDRPVASLSVYHSNKFVKHRESNGRTI